MDSNRVASSGATAGKFWSCDDSLQGIPIGWGDLNENSLPDQWIDLGTDPDGACGDVFSRDEESVFPRWDSPRRDIELGLQQPF